MSEREELLALRDAFEREKAKNAIFRRKIEDMLYNLDADNMPKIEERLYALEVWVYSAM